MTEKHIRVWVQQFQDRSMLMLQWIDPVTGKRKSKSAETKDPDKVETKRSELEYELNHGLHKEASRMSWEKFRELFEAEYVSGRRQNTRDSFTVTFNSFERLCNPRSLRSITERTISAFVGALRKEPGSRGRTNQESTIKARLQFQHTALNWAAKQKLIPACPAFPRMRSEEANKNPSSPETRGA